jgi:hypothetical protein
MPYDCRTVKATWEILLAMRGGIKRRTPLFFGWMAVDRFGGPGSVIATLAKSCPPGAAAPEA